MSVDNEKIYVDSLSDSSDEYSFSGSDGTVKHAIAIIQWNLWEQITKKHINSYDWNKIPYKFHLIVKDEEICWK